MDKKLLDQVKELTWLFTDEDIINKYNEIQNSSKFTEGQKK